MNINIYNPYVRQELELYHHGVLGQRWGKKNGPPYPLAASAHSASEKKAGWRNSIYDNGKGTHFSRKVEKYIAKKGDGSNTRRARKSLNLLERQKAKDIYEIRKEQRKGSYSDQEKIKQHIANIEAGEKKAKELIKSYSDKGYTIASAKVMRDAAYGKHIFTNGLVEFAGIPIATVGHTIYRKGDNYVEGNRYRVSDKTNPKYLKRNDEGRDYEYSDAEKNIAKAVDTAIFKLPGGVRTSNYRRVNQITTDDNYYKQAGKAYKEHMNAIDNYNKLMSRGADKTVLNKAEKNIRKKENLAAKMTSRVDALDRAGYSRAEIAKKLGIPEGSVGYYLEKYK